MSKATRIYRDNFVYSINTALCNQHAALANRSKSQYAYIEAFNGNAECAHCESDKRQRCLQNNSINWTLIKDGQVILQSCDRIEFWREVRARYMRDEYSIEESYPNKCEVKEYPL